MEKFNKHFGYINKLAPYQLNYRCDSDCSQFGCPYHVAMFEISHSTDTFSVDFGDGEKIWLDGVRMAMILDFANRMNPNYLTNHNEQ